jgi:lysophospholipase L1-like esterase
MAVSAVVSAPSKTQAQLRVEAGQNAIKNKPYPVAIQAPTQVIHKPAHPKAEAHGANQAPITGSMITVIGDSVTIASAPALQARFPGILIDAEISRSLRVGGFEAVDKLALSGGLRDVVVVALATNGYFGTGNLDKLVAQLGNRKIIFVTAHVTREWTEANNVDVHALVKNYPNVTVAEWNDMITNHPEDLGDDNIHPNAQGGEIYASSIAVALEKPE